MSDCSKLLSLRNGYYQGELKLSRKHGKGILLTDDGKIIVGEFKQDQLSGSAFVFLNQNQYAFMDFNRGELEGHAYIRAQSQMLFLEFAGNKPVGKILLNDYESNTTKLLNFRSPIYEVQETHQNDTKDVIEKHLKVKYLANGIVDYLEKHFLGSTLFELKTLSNGYMMFRFNEKSNPISVGFVLNKNEKLMSFGLYVNDKLHGYGCKFENNVRYEGVFENGSLNGLGLKLASSKYSFGRFENGNLTEAVYLEERANTSETELKELKRLEHIKSLHFNNCYLEKDLIRFRGIAEVSLENPQEKEYLYAQNQATLPKRVNNLDIKALKTERRNPEEIEARSSRTAFPFGKKNQDRASETGSALPNLRRYQLNLND